MKRILILLFFFLPLSLSAQQTMYVAAKNGLGLRNDNNGTALVLTTITYGSMVTIDTVPSGKKDTVIEINGLPGIWIPVTYQGQHGYVFEGYLLPIAPPASGTKNMQEYAAQLSAQTCEPFVHIDTSEYHEYPAPRRTVIKDIRTLYRNGAIYTSHQGWLNTSQSLILQGINIQQAFLIAQNIGELKELMYSNTFPKNNETEPQEEETHDTKVMYETTTEQGELLKVCFWVDGMESHNELSIYMLNPSQVVITLDWNM